MWSLGVTLFELLVCDCKLEQLPVRVRGLDPAARPTAENVAHHLAERVDAALREQFSSLQSGFDA